MNASPERSSFLGAESTTSYSKNSSAHRNQPVLVMQPSSSGGRALQGQHYGSKFVQIAEAYEGSNPSNSTQYQAATIDQALFQKFSPQIQQMNGSEQHVKFSGAKNTGF